ncbi:MAG: sigma-54-dependent Fis family transcriptional regulator [Gammaproteobacteria bacterium]|nr:sigma-54-dependent Fis family transcriptional regulator [Gammaproteobacteria bacterium]PCH62697.1 MAG: sigma-54-dependent Fis family transcriptional regulator [Gammaproteobacteria bacterium]PCH64142.1 MAG: sigma-54-dependent Fis family transcriptional regulator [Gammaproteobacteria bacterium]
MNQSTVLVVEDDSDLREALCDTLRLAGYEVESAWDGRSALEIVNQRKDDLGLIISDIQMTPMDGVSLLKRVRRVCADIPVLLMTAYGTIEQAVSTLREGAADYMVKPFEAKVLVSMVSRYIIQHDDTSDFICAAVSSKKLATLARRVALSDATVLISGESGTGKEVIARYIHDNSARNKGVFVAINCAAIPDNMLEATLFGYEKGAFTGAYNASPGKFEQAQGGTLLLDEISEMNISLQAKILRVLQEREVERLGGNKLIELDVRVLATTNRNLAAEVKSNRFREDLFYRLNVFPLQIGALRERKEDILPLAVSFIERIAIQQSQAIPVLTKSAEEHLLSHPWPGNVRELDNVIQRAMILQLGDEIEEDDLQLTSFNGFETSIMSSVEQTHVDADNLAQDMLGHEHNLILDALSNGNRKQAAEKLGISQRTLRYKLAKMRDSGIEVPRRAVLV